MIRRALLLGALASGTAAAAGLGPLPAHWQGTLPCADCPGIAQRLELRPDGRFVLDLTYLQPKGGPDQHLRETGHWQRERRDRLRLDDPTGRRYLAVDADGSLRPLDIHGQRIDSPLIQPMRRESDGETAWRLSELDGRPVATDTGRPPPTLRLDAAHRRIAGTTGCNRFGGEYRSWGASGFSVLPLATTRMACAAPQDEADFLRALARATHRIQTGQTLELLTDGVPVARFVAEPAAPRP